MWGAIIGDIVGSPYEGGAPPPADAALFADKACFTDDTVCTIAVADALLAAHGTGAAADFAGYLRRWTRRFPRAGYGPMFLRWAFADDAPAYGSWGNGSAMRVSPVAWAASDAEQAVAWAASSAAVSHDHPEAIDGAEAVALVIWHARHGAKPPTLRAIAQDRYGDDVMRALDDVRATAEPSVACRDTVPDALVCAFEAHSLEEAVRNAVSLGGDTDTLAAIAGSVAEALFGVPDDLLAAARRRVDPALLDIADRFTAQFGG